MHIIKSKNHILGLIISAVSMITMASSIVPNALNAEPGKCNSQGTSIGDPHGFRNPTGNPHDTDNDDSDDDTGNPHRECDPNDDE